MNHLVTQFMQLHTFNNRQKYCSKSLNFGCSWRLQLWNFAP